MHRAWYAVTAVPLVICTVIAGLMTLRLVNSVEGMQRGVMPGTLQVKLDPGDHMIYAEYRSVLGGITYGADSYTLDCTLTAADGADIRLVPYEGTLEYSFGDFEGRALYATSVGQAGTHTLACKSTVTPRIVVAVGESFAGKLVSALLMFFAGMIASIIGLVMMIVRRKRALAAYRAAQQRATS